MSAPQRAAPSYGRGSDTVVRSASPSLALTPDGYGSGVGGIMTRENVDQALESQGLSTNAVQVGILKAKVQGLQSELFKVKNDARETSEKLSQSSAKLNEQKIQNSALLHKQNAIMAKLSQAETNERDLEEALIAEKKNHVACRDSLEKTRASRDDLEITLHKLRDQMTADRASLPAVEKSADRSLFIPTKEHNEMQDRFRRAHEILMDQVKSSFERLSAAQEEDETALFISRSAVLSSATDLETKLCHTENVLEVMRATMDQFTREFEEDTGRMLLSLMNENKELWATVSKLQFEADRATSELVARGKRDDYVHRDQLDYVQQQLSVSDERLKKAHEAVEQQLEIAKQHAERMREVLEESEELRRRLQEAEEELDQLRNTLQAREQEHDSIALQNKSLSRQVSELGQTNLHLQNQLATANDELQRTRVEYDTEARAAIRQLQTELQDVGEVSARYKSDLDDALQRLATAERELEMQTISHSNHRNEWENQHENIVRALQDELSSNKTVYEGEIEDLRRDLAVQGDELHRAVRDLEKERFEGQSSSGTLRATEETRAHLEKELATSKSNQMKAEEKLRKLQSELDSARAASAASESKTAALVSEQSRLLNQLAQVERVLSDERDRHEAQHSSLEHDYRDVERSRTVLVEEVSRLRARSNEDHAFRSLRERMEKDKEQLMAENVRLHESYQEVQQLNVNLQQQLSQLKGRISNFSALQQQLEDVQRRLTELPALRQQAEEARREASRAREETEVLRQERDEMSQRLEFFLEESRVAVKKDTDLDKLFREASSQVKRLDQQIDEVTKRQPSRQIAAPPIPSRYRDTTPDTTYEGRRSSPPRPWH